MAGAPQLPIRFSDFELDLAALQLRRADEVIPLEPQVFDVLAYLAAHRERVVPKTELLDNVWGDRFVSESALTSRIKTARQAVDDDGRRQEVIRTAHGRGYQFVADVHEHDPPPTPATTRAVPTPMSTLIGRDDEITAIDALLDDDRLVTVIGSGGVGKTRLATEIARIWEDRGDRNVFVPLESVTDPTRLVPTLLSALGIRAETEVDLVAVLAEAVRDERALIVLDNFEQIIDAAADLARLISAAPGVHLLVTSRERLRLTDERVVEVSPLPDDDATRMFEAAARRAQPDFELSDENAAVVATVCEIVDGLPLALELAAAQLRYVPLDYLASHLRSNVVTIADEVRDRPTRQHSVGSLIQWSHGLLPPAEQRLLARLSVFPGEWTLEGAAAVGRLDSTAAALGSVSTLIDKSLVARSGRDRGRFLLLNVIREFARVQLDESSERATTQAAHGAYVAGVVRSIELGRWDKLAASWIDDLAHEYDDVVAALDRASGDDLDGADAALLGQIVGDLNIWWYRAGRHREGREWLRAALGAGDGVEPASLGRLHFGAGFMTFADRDIDGARTRFEAAVEHAARAGDWRYEQLAAAYLSATSIRRSEEFDTSLARLDAIVAEATERMEESVLANALNVSGVLLQWEGHVAEARDRLHRALDANRRIGDRYQQAMNLANLGHLAGRMDDLVEALDRSKEALGLSWRIGSQMMSAWVVGQVAHFRHRTGDHEDAALLLGAADAVIESLGAHHGPTAHQSFHDDTVTELVEALGTDRFADLTRQGRALKLETAVELALDG